jgi:5-methylcytosine-specific restriction endonuclease McrA
MFDYLPVPKPTSKRRVKKTGERSKFSKMVRDAIKEKYNGQCQLCGRLAFHVHHCMPRSRSGRNVYTNATLLCAACHRQVHEDERLLKYFIEKHKKLYGKNFYRDKEDLIFKYKTDKLAEMDEEARLWVKYNKQWGHGDEVMFN